MEERAEMYRTSLVLLHLRMLRLDFNTHPEMFQAAEYAGRCLGTIDYIRQIPLDLQKYRLKLPMDLCEKHLVNVRNLWNRVNGTPKEELYDVVLQ